MSKKYTNIAESEHKDWKFENLTTSRVIKLTLKTPENRDPASEIWMDYQEFEQLI